MDPHILKEIAHRPWPLPDTPWLMRQTWEKLLFAHWPFPPEALAGKIPEGMTLDTFNGQAWVGVVPFEMSYAFRGVPFPVRFRELNVRTYVTVNQKPGVLFFSLDATDLLVVAGARLFYHLPYYASQIQISSQENIIHYDARRNHPKAPQGILKCLYQPVSEISPAPPGSLEYWLTERYCLYTADRNNAIHKSDVHHLPWPLRAAEASFLENTMTQAHGLTLPDVKPLLHYSDFIEVFVWPLERVPLTC